MSAVAVPATRNGSAPALAGLGLMLGFVLRRNAVRLVVWLVVVIGMTVITAAYYKTQFTTSAALAGRAALGDSPGMKTVFGAVTSTGLGAAIWSEVWMFIAVALSIGMIFLVTRNSRADEEHGRSELLLSRPISAGSGLAGSVIVLTLVIAAAAVGTALACAAFGLDPSGAGQQGSWVMGVSVAGVGLVGLGVAAVANQLASTGRGANALALGILALFYLLRAVGDLKQNALTWVSPIGWGEKMDPWGADRWWPLILTVALFGLCVTTALVLRVRRDYDAGLFRPRPGRTRAGVFSTTEFGLVLRMNRGSALAWLIGIAGWAALLGSTLTDMKDLAAQLALVTGGNGLDGIIALWMRVTALIVAGLVVLELVTLRTDEEHGLMEARLAGDVSRWRLVGTRLVFTGVLAVVVLTVAGAVMGLIYGAAVSEPVWTGRVTAAALAQLPSLAIVASIAVALGGWFPRLFVPLSWTVVGLAWIVALFGNALRIPSGILDKLPFSGVDLPANAPAWPTMVVTALIAIVLLVVGLFGYRRRDIPR